MAKKRKLTYDELWDDSYLLESWGSALKEYEKYHSIHARGEKTEDIPELREFSEDSIEGTANSGDIKSHDEDFEDVELEEETIEEEGEEQSKPTASTGVGAPFETSATEPVIPNPAGLEHSMPHALAASVRDEGLKNLMMSWYYAGYYTGFHEGQQQASLRGGRVNEQGQINKEVTGGAAKP